MFAALTLQQRLIAGAIVIAALVVALYAFGQVRWAAGYTAGALSNAAPLAKCETALATTKETSDALKREAEQRKQESAELDRRGREGVHAAVDYWTAHPRIVRVCNGKDRGAGGVRTATPDSAGVPGDAAGSGLGAPGTPAEIISEAELNDRLNKAEIALAKLAWILDRDDEMTRNGLLK